MTGTPYQTTLPGGERVWKDDPRLEACGTVDELNAWIGILRAFLSENPEALHFQRIQQALITIGSFLVGADRIGTFSEPSSLDEESRWLEGLIYKTEGELPRLSLFVLPGSERLEAFIHVARTVCRRAERRVVTLIRRESHDEKPNDHYIPVLRYLNLLSRFLFFFARKFLHEQGTRV